MKQLSSALLILTFLLGACSTEVPATETDAPQSTLASSTVENSSTATESTAPLKEAVLSKIENTVSARESAEKDFAPAAVNMKLLPTGGVETGEDGRARVDLLPEGTIIRVGPNSSFMLPVMTDENGEPKTVLELFFGKVFILLNGGSLDVKTPSGVASVRGSLLSVEVDEKTNKVIAACMEGDCTITGDDGEEMDIPEGEETFIDEGELPMDPFPMDRDEVQEWLDENPEMLDYLPELPDLENFPDLPENFDGDMENLPEEFLPEGFLDDTPPPIDSIDLPEPGDGDLPGLGDGDPPGSGDGDLPGPGDGDPTGPGDGDPTEP